MAFEFRGKRKRSRNGVGIVVVVLLFGNIKMKGAGGKSLQELIKDTAVIVIAAHVVSCICLHNPKVIWAPCGFLVVFLAWW